jgi:glyoxylase-like metal-dependent hydrolase (beta-lactamase superfamily II)
VRAEARADQAGEGASADLPGRATIDLAVGQLVRISDSSNSVDLIALPRSHSRGDLLVHLRDHDLIALGAFIDTSRLPFGADAHLRNWVRVLNRVIKMDPKLIVPMRGPVVKKRDVGIQRDSLAWLRGRIDIAFRESIPLEKIPEFVLESEELERFFDVENAVYDLRGMILNGIEEARAQRRKRGLE